MKMSVKGEQEWEKLTVVRTQKGLHGSDGHWEGTGGHWEEERNSWEVFEWEMLSSVLVRRDC